MRTWAVTIILVATIFAGCLASDENDTDDESGGGSAQVQSSNVLIEGNRVVMDVPVPVFLIGFSAEVASQSEVTLQEFPVSGGGALSATARFEIHTPSAQWQADFDQFLGTAAHPGNGQLTGFNGPILDGNAIETELAATLPQIHQVPDGLTSLVVLDPGLRGHAYNYEGNVGWREPVRLFGEHSSLLIWDPYAEVDPWAGSGQPHHVPVSDASAQHIADWAVRATGIRALQTPIWGPTTETCHAITVIFAVRGTTVTPTALGLQTWDEALDQEALKATFENLTNDEVFVDVVVLQLPVDDPPLELITRENNARAITQSYLDLNFDQYHVPHGNCEPYLSLVVYGDLADQRTSSNGNAVMMSASGNRISTSLVAENVRVMSEAIGYQEVWDESTDFERVGPGADPLEWFNWVVAHETGHLFSLPHPNSGGGYSDTGFASTWNVMGYQMRRIVTETSLVDTNNMQRNQAAYSLVSVSDVPESAIIAMGEYRWKDVTRIIAEMG